MKWSSRIGQVAGIGIQIHWTFLRLIGLLALENVAELIMVQSAL